MKKILLLTLAVLLLIGCGEQNSNKDVAGSPKAQEEKVIVNDETDEKKVKQKNISKSRKEVMMHNYFNINNLLVNQEALHQSKKVRIVILYFFCGLFVIGIKFKENIYKVIIYEVYRDTCFLIMVIKNYLILNNKSTNLTIKREY